MRKTTITILGLIAAIGSMCAPADVTVMAVRLGAKDVVTLAKFYETAFGLKEIDRVGQPPTEIIMRYGTSVAAAKAGSSPEFLLTRREPNAASDTMPHAIFHVSDMNASVAAAKSAGATMKGNVASVQIGKMPVKVAQLADPEGNMLELMELPKGADHIQHP
jgi:predicted enzyme related to lactoylglutathione lyase